MKEYDINYEYITKNHEFGRSLSWNFVKGKGKYSNKSINNSDSDTGVFEF